MTAPTSPAPPCVEIRDPEHGKVYIDRDGRAWTVDSRRIPELDAPPADRVRAVSLGEADDVCPACGVFLKKPALEPSMSAEECGNRLAGLWLSMQAGLTVGHDFRADFSRNSETIGRMLGLESAALALGPSVLAAFEKARGGA